MSMTRARTGGEGKGTGEEGVSGVVRVLGNRETDEVDKNGALRRVNSCRKTRRKLGELANGDLKSFTNENLKNGEVN